MKRKAWPSPGYTGRMYRVSISKRTRWIWLSDWLSKTWREELRSYTIPDFLVSLREKNDSTAAVDGWSRFIWLMEKMTRKQEDSWVWKFERHPKSCWWCGNEKEDDIRSISPVGRHPEPEHKTIEVIPRTVQNENALKYWAATLLATSLP